MGGLITARVQSDASLMLHKHDCDLWRSEEEAGSYRRS